MDLAKAVSVTQAAISQLENGKRRPTPALVTKIARVLRVDRDLLVGQSEGEFEKAILMRNLKGLTQEDIKKINDYAELIKQGKNNP